MNVIHELFDASTTQTRVLEDCGLPDFSQGDTLVLLYTPVNFRLSQKPGLTKSLRPNRQWVHPGKYSIHKKIAKTAGFWALDKFRKVLINLHPITVNEKGSRIM